MVKNEHAASVPLESPSPNSSPIRLAIHESNGASKRLPNIPPMHPPIRPASIPKSLHLMLSLFGQLHWTSHQAPLISLHALASKPEIHPAAIIDNPPVLESINPVRIDAKNAQPH